MASKTSLGNLTEADLKGKAVLLRADLNVPLDDDQNITDDSSIRASVPTIKFLTEKGAKVILASHPERPKGVTPKFSLKPLVPRLSELLEVDVAMTNDCIGEEFPRMVASVPDGGVLLLNDARFYEEGEKDDHVFSKAMASVLDLYFKYDGFADGPGFEADPLTGAISAKLSDSIDTAIGKNGLLDKTGQHIPTDDNSVGKSHRTLQDDFASDVITSGLEDEKLIHHITGGGGRGGGASRKVQEGKGLQGVFDWSRENGVVSGDVHRTHLSDGGDANTKVQEGNARASQSPRYL